MKNRGFTLIELLVVISIIALLLSILMPGLQKAKEQAQLVVCRSQLKQISLASVLWSEDNDGWCGAGYWCYENIPITTMSGETILNTGSLDPYVSTTRNRIDSVYVCPSAKKIQFSKSFEITYEQMGLNRKQTYATNGWMAYNFSRQSPGDCSGASNGPWDGVASNGRSDERYSFKRGATRLITVRQPSATAYFLDHEYNIAAPFSFNPLKPPATIWAGWRDAPVQTRWHKKKGDDDYGKANFSWLDGHVSLEPDDLESESDYRKRWEYYFWDH